jgi:hypothetical protein
MAKKKGGSGFQFPAVAFVGGLLVGMFGIVAALMAVTESDYTGAGLSLLASAVAFGLLSLAALRA